MRTVVLLLSGLVTVILAWFMLIVTLALISAVGPWEIALAMILSVMTGALLVTILNDRML